MPLVSQTPAVASSSGSPVVGAVMMGAVGVALIVGPLVWWLRQHRRDSDVPRSEHLRRVAQAYGSMALGGMFLAALLQGLLAEPGQRSPALMWVYLFLACSACALVPVVAVVRAVERRRDRRLRRDLGLTVLRRRLHWGWFVGAWWIGFPFLAAAVGWVVLMVLIGSGRFDVGDSGSQPAPAAEDVLMLVFLGLYFGGAAVIGMWQAYRRRVRDRQIEDADLPVVDLARVNDNRPSPAIPGPVARAWRTWQAALDAPVQPGQEAVTIAVPVMTHLAWLGAVTVTGANMLSTAPGTLGAVIGLAALAVAALILYSILVVPMSTGARTALRQLRTRPAND